MSVYDDLVPFEPAKAWEVEISEAQQRAEATKNAATVALAEVTLEAAKILYDIMTKSEDNNERLRAIEMVFSRTIPKIAAKHIEDNDGTVDSADTAALRDSILEEIQKKHGSKKDG